jgi:hypothetical protein
MACKCTVLLTDDHNEGNNQAIIRCQLAEGHAANIGETSHNSRDTASKARSSSNGIATSTTAETLMIMKSAGKDDTAANFGRGVILPAKLAIPWSQQLLPAVRPDSTGNWL